MFHSQDIQLSFAFLTIQSFTKSVMSRWVLVHEIVSIFELYLFNHNSLTHFSQVSHFYTFGFLTFSGVLKCDTGPKWVKSPNLATW